jgi:hypothetical protein
VMRLIAMNVTDRGSSCVTWWNLVCPMAKGAGPRKTLPLQTVEELMGVGKVDPQDHVFMQILYDVCV